MGGRRFISEGKLVSNFPKSLRRRKEITYQWHSVFYVLSSPAADVPVRILVRHLFCLGLHHLFEASTVLLRDRNVGCTGKRSGRNRMLQKSRVFLKRMIRKKARNQHIRALSGSRPNRGMIRQQFPNTATRPESQTWGDEAGRYADDLPCQYAPSLLDGRFDFRRREGRAFDTSTGAVATWYLE